MGRPPSPCSRCPSSKSTSNVRWRAVDVVTAKQIKNPNLAAAIEREKVLVYER